MNRNPVFLLVVAAILGGMLFSSPAVAIQASPVPVALKQPDGTPIVLRVRGDEYQNWFEDLRGYTVIRAEKTYVYAASDAVGRLVATSWRVGSVDPEALGLTPGLTPPPAKRPDAPTRAVGAKDNPTSGTIKNLVVLCMFSDHVQGTHTRPREDYEKVFNAAGGDPSLAPTGSVRDYYLEASYGALTIDSTIAPWVTLPHDEAYYAASNNGLGGTYPNNAKGMVKDALDLLDPLIDFTEFDGDEDGYIDAITVIHSGYAAETGGGNGNWIWSHRSSLWPVSGTGWASEEGVHVYDYHNGGRTLEHYGHGHRAHRRDLPRNRALSGPARPLRHGRNTRGGHWFVGVDGQQLGVRFFAAPSAPLLFVEQNPARLGDAHAPDIAR